MVYNPKTLEAVNKNIIITAQSLPLSFLKYVFLIMKLI